MEEDGYDSEDNLERIWYYLEEYLEENGGSVKNCMAILMNIPDENYRIFLYCLNKAWQDVKALPECITKLIDKKMSTIKDDSLRVADEDGRTG